MPPSTGESNKGFGDFSVRDIWGIAFELDQRIHLFDSWTDQELISCFNFFQDSLSGFPSLHLEMKNKTKSLASSSFSIIVTDDEKKMRFTTEQVHSLILFVSIVSLSLLLSLAFSALVNLLWFSSTMISVRIWNPTSKYDSWTFLCLLFSFSFLSCSVARSVILYKIRFNTSLTQNWKYSHLIQCSILDSYWMYKKKNASRLNLGITAAELNTLTKKEKKLPK